MAQNKERIFYIDAIRAFAIFSILVTHVLLNNIEDKWYGFITLYFGSASMFFMTSGALIFPVTKAGAFYKRRFRAYVPQFVVWSLIYVALGYLYSHNGQAATKQLEWMLFTPTFTVGWFCYTLTGLYLFAPVISPWLCGASKRAVEWFLVAWLVSGFFPIAKLYTYMRPMPEWTLAPFYNFMGFMVAGYYFYKWPMFSRGHRERTILLAVLTIVGVVIAGRFYFTLFKYNVHQPLTYDLSINVMMVCLLWFAAAQYIRRAPRLVSKVVTVLSVCSLEIYLCHMAWLRYVVNPLGLSLWLSIPLLLVLSIGTGVLLRYIAQRIGHS